MRATFQVTVCRQYNIANHSIILQVNVVAKGGVINFKLEQRPHFLERISKFLDCQTIPSARVGKNAFWGMCIPEEE